MKRVGTTMSVVLLAALSCIPCMLPLISMPETSQEEDRLCSSIPETFQESDLYGTWQSRYYPGVVTDTLVLREGGTYQQIYDNERTGDHYTSLWNRWYMEYRASGGLYLHLEGMRYCLGTSEVCRREGGGGGNHPYYDFCEDRTVRDMGNEVVLAVTGKEEGFPGADSPPRGILLWHMKFNPEGTDNFFALQE
jgi:hypothetical protein